MHPTTSFFFSSSLSLSIYIHFCTARNKIGLFSLRGRRGETNDVNRTLRDARRACLVPVAYFADRGTCHHRTPSGMHQGECASSGPTAHAVRRAKKQAGLQSGRKR